MPRNEAEAEHLLAKVTTALTSDGSLTAPRPLCEVIAFLTQQDGHHVQDAVGKSLCTNLLRFFLNSANGLLLRRWSGLLLYELCRRSERTVELLIGQKTTTASLLSGLGRIVQLQDDREDLKLVSCMIMSELALKNVDQHLLWPSQTKRATFVHGDSQEWMVGLQTVLDSFSESQASQASMFYPRAVQAGRGLSFDEQTGRLLMLIEDRLTVVVTPPAAHHTFYVDVPFENIVGVTILLELEVRLDLVSTSGSWTYVVNAEPYRTDAIFIELATADQAQQVLKEIQQRCRLGKASHQQKLRSARSSSAALVFDGTPGSDYMGFEPPNTLLGGTEDPLQVHDAPPMAEAEHNAAQGRLTHGARFKDQTPAQEDPDEHVNSGGEEQEDNDVDQITAVVSPGLARNGFEKSPHNNPTHVSTENTKTQSKEESSIYSLPEESPGPTIQPEESRKRKGKGEGGATQPAPQPLKRESKGKPSRGRKRKLGQKRKSDETESDDGDDEYQPGQQQRTSHDTSGRVTRASAAQKSHSNGPAQTQSGRPTIVEQVAETPPKPSGNLPPVQQLSDGSKREAYTTLAGSNARHRSGSRQQQRYPSGSVDWKKPQLLPPSSKSKKLKVEIGAFGDDEDCITHPGIGEAVAYEHPETTNRKTVKAKAVNEKAPARRPRLDRKQESSSEAGESQHNAMVVSSDESNISTSEQDENSKPRSNIKPSEHRIEHEDMGPLEHETRSTNEPTRHIAKPKHDLRGTQPAKYAEKKMAEMPFNSSRKRRGVEVFEESSVLNSLSRADEQSGSAGRRSLIDEHVSRESSMHAYDLPGLRHEERHSTRKTPDHTKPVRTTYSSGKFRKKRERDRFGSLIDQEEGSSKAAPAPAYLLPNERSAGLDNSQKGDKLISADHNEDEVGSNLPAMLLAKQIRRNDDVLEADSLKSPTSLRLEDPVEDFASVATPVGFSSSVSIGQPISAAFEAESSPLARHSSRNAYVSSVRPGKKQNTASQNQSQESAPFDSGEPEDGPYRPPFAQRAKAEVTSTLRNMDGTLLKRVKQVQHDGITSVLESATEPRGMDCEPVVPAVLTQPRLISAKGLDNLQLSDAIPQQDAGEVRAVISRSQVEGRLTSEKHQMGGNVARHHKDVTQHRRVQGQPKRVVSSNSKKVPESPGADSKAITIHIPQRLLMTSRSLQTPAQPLMDPFHGQASTPGRPKDETRFMRNLRKQMEEKARTTQMKRNDDGRECADDDDPDRTLVDMIEDAFDMDSAEDKSSTALVSSTDAESNGHYEKMEWERSLKPHQRAIFDVLTRISRHFVRHLIDSETAIEDILQDFEADGTRLIELMEETHRKEYDTQRKCLLEARTHLSRALLRIKDQVVEHERQARITLLSNSWEKEESVSKKHISHLEKMLNQKVDP